MRLNLRAVVLLLFGCTPDMAIGTTPLMLMMAPVPNLETTEPLVPDSTLLKAVKVQTDSLRAETCRGGTLLSNGNCSGRKQAPRTTVIVRLANRVDSLNRAALSQQPPPVVSPAPVDTEPTPPDTVVTQPPPPTGSLNAELPRQFVRFTEPACARQTAVATSTALQTALNAAIADDCIVLQDGAQFVGNFTASSCRTGWITIRAQTVRATGANRMRPSLSANAPKIVTANNEPALHFPAGSCRWMTKGVEITVASSVTASVYGIVRMEGSQLSLRHNYIHGQPASQVVRCVTMNGTWQEADGNWISDCHASGFDSQAIMGGDGNGPIRIANNHLEGAGENVMFGGFMPSVRGTIPQDIEIVRNYFFTPASWIGVWAPKKNLFELKNAKRVLVEGNVFEGSWDGGQNGVAIVFKSSNDGGPNGGCTWCITADVTFRRNLIRKAARGMDLIAADQYFGTVDSTLRRITVTETVFDSLNQIAPFTGSGRGFLIGDRMPGIEITRTVVSGALGWIIQIADGQQSGTGCRFTDNVWAIGEYGIFASGGAMGTAALNKLCAPGWVWSGMTLIGSGPAWLYPTGTTWAATEPALAAEIRALVSTAVAGVVVLP